MLQINEVVSRLDDQSIGQSAESRSLTGSTVRSVVRKRETVTLLQKSAVIFIYLHRSLGRCDVYLTSRICKVKLGKNTYVSSNSFPCLGFIILFTCIYVCKCTGTLRFWLSNPKAIFTWLPFVESMVLCDVKPSLRAAGFSEAVLSNMDDCDTVDCSKFKQKLARSTRKDWVKPTQTVFVATRGIIDGSKAISTQKKVALAREKPDQFLFASAGSKKLLATGRPVAFPEVREWISELLISTWEHGTT